MSDVIPLRPPKEPHCICRGADIEDGKEVLFQVYDDGKIEISVNGDRLRLSAAEWHRHATEIVP